VGLFAFAGKACFAKMNFAPGSSYIGGNGSCLHGCGIVFKLTPNKSGSWTETILHQFGTSSGDGAGPQGSLVFDK
jgi:hypothetical protein